MIGLKAQQEPLRLSGKVPDPYLRGGWVEDDVGDAPGHITAYVVNEKAGWTAEQVWGFTMVNGERHGVTQV